MQRKNRTDKRVKRAYSFAEGTFGQVDIGCGGWLKKLISSC